MEIVDVRPETPRDETPILFAPSWAATIKVYEPVLEELYGYGRRALSLSHPRTGDEIVFREGEAVVAKEYPKEEVRKALNILSLLEEKGIEKTDVIAHSEGAINTLIAAKMHPERFRAVVLFGPAGLVGKESLVRLGLGSIKHSKGRETHPTLSALPIDAQERKTAEIEGAVIGNYAEIPETERSKWVAQTYGEESKTYVLANLRRAVSELVAISNTQIEKLMNEVHAFGVGIMVMSGVDDSIFPMERMQKMTKAKDIDGFLSVRGGHGQIGEHPEHFLYAAENMLETYAAKRNATVTSNTNDLLK